MTARNIPRKPLAAPRIPKAGDAFECDTCADSGEVYVEVLCHATCKEPERNNGYHTLEIPCPCCSQEGK